MTRILHAEDDIFLRRATQMILEYEGYELTQVEDGLQAIRSLEKFLPDLLITDLRMPNASGYEVISSLDRIGYRGRVILTTAEEFIDKSRLIYSGEVLLLKKPCGLSEFRGTIRRALSQ